MSIVQKIKDTGGKFLLDYVSSLGADITNRALFGSDPATKEILAKVDRLLKEGKVDEATKTVTEAFSTVEENLLGVGEADEEIQAQDTLNIIRLGLVTKQKGIELIEFLSILSPEQRRRIRKGNAKEKNAERREDKWAELANLDDEVQRYRWIVANGWVDPTELERLQEFDRKTFGAAASSFQDKKAEFSRRHPTSFTRPARSFWSWFNPFD